MSKSVEKNYRLWSRHGAIGDPDKGTPGIECFFINEATMSVDVSTEIVIRRPREQVADYTANPDNAPAWYENIQEIEWKSPPPLVPGSRIAFVATFLGRRLEYTYEIIEFEPGSRLVMTTSEGPFPMETTYMWEETVDGSTRMTLRNQGSPSGFSSLLAPVLASNIRRENRKDLAKLKEILESKP
jgi:uncharacterized membrane protein